MEGEGVGWGLLSQGGDKNDGKGGGRRGVQAGEAKTAPAGPCEVDRGKGVGGGGWGALGLRSASQHSPTHSPQTADAI